MRDAGSIKAEAEDKFLAAHPHWSMERRVQDDHGIVWLSFRVDRAAERKANRPLGRSNLYTIPVIKRIDPSGELGRPSRPAGSVRPPTQCPREDARDYCRATAHASAGGTDV